MPDQFPHLQWTHSGTFEAKFPPGAPKNIHAENAKADRKAHQEKIGGQLAVLKNEFEASALERLERGLPDIRGKGFILQIPEGTDIDQLAYSVGIDLVAETESGLMFVATDNIDLVKLQDVLTKFGTGSRGGGAAANIVEIFHSGDDQKRLRLLLKGRVYKIWPVDEEKIYTFDLGIQTSNSTRSVKWTRALKKKPGQSDLEHEDIVADQRRKDRINADEQWQKVLDERLDEVQEIITHYNGEIVNSLITDVLKETRKAVVFPDSLQIRIKMNGEGFRDLVRNLPHLFEVAFPPEIEYLPGSAAEEGDDGDLEIFPPKETSPKICVIDSGIQEGHRWIEPAMDSTSSHCFIPEKDDDDVADHVSPHGHGTRVAGAILYPLEIPKKGKVEVLLRLQNARVLDENNELPKSLPPSRYLEEVMDHFNWNPEEQTKIFNHSITSKDAADGTRMSAWAAKLDHLSHRDDILFIQAAGNIKPLFVAQIPEDYSHLDTLLDPEAAIRDPGQALHVLTVGSVSHVAFKTDDSKTFASEKGEPSSFSSSGHSPLWDVIKPEVVEWGGDYCHAMPISNGTFVKPESCPELLASTLHGQPAISCSDVGTSFTAPKVAHVAGHLQNIFPDASPLLYRALIVQSARFPENLSWKSDVEKALKLMGYGIPSLERASQNNKNRITLLTPDSVELQSKKYHLYEFEVPETIRSAAQEGSIRIDVTMAYTAEPRRTRSRRTGYLETWLDWRAIHQDEPLEHFEKRMQRLGDRKNYPGYKWQIHQGVRHGATTKTRRDLGTVQKDWCEVEANQLPETFALVVRAHCGWNHKEAAGFAKYCLVVTFESLGANIPIYEEIRATIETETEVRTSS